MFELTLINIVLNIITIVCEWRNSAISVFDSTNIGLVVVCLLAFMTNTMAFNYVMLARKTILL